MKRGRIGENLDRIRRDLAARTVSVPSVSLAQKLGMARIHGTMGKAVLKAGAARSYLVTDARVRRGVCARVCPAENTR